MVLEDLTGYEDQIIDAYRVYKGRSSWYHSLVDH